MSLKTNKLSQFTKRLEKTLSDSERKRFFKKATQELQDTLHELIHDATPVGVYPSKSGRVGGNLRRGWTSQPVRAEGSKYIGEISNDVEYAIYVEYGHRTRGGSGWVEGQFFTTTSIEDLRPTVPALLERMLDNWLGGIYD